MRVYVAYGGLGAVRVSEVVPPFVSVSLSLCASSRERQRWRPHSWALALLEWHRASTWRTAYRQTDPLLAAAAATAATAQASAP
jgi:hypothetical protein